VWGECHTSNQGWVLASVLMCYNVKLWQTKMFAESWYVARLVVVFDWMTQQFHPSTGGSRYWRTGSPIFCMTRSSATAEKRRVSYACLFRLANWSCSAQNNSVAAGLSSFKFVQCAPKDASFLQTATECVLAVEGHPRSIDDFGSNRKRIILCDFLLVYHCDYGPI